MDINENERQLTGYPSIDKPWLKYFIKNADKCVGEDTNIYKFVLNANRDNLYDYALEYFGHKITYMELFENVYKVAKSLKAYGVSKGDFVSLCLPNIPEMVYFVYAINRIGAVACLIDPRTNAEGILNRANDSNSKLVVAVLDILEDKITPIASRLTAKRIISVSPSDSLSALSLVGLSVKIMYMFKEIKLPSKVIKYKHFLDFGSKMRTQIDGKVSGDDTAIIVYTSGTTGTPKGVMLSNKNIIFSKRLIEYGVSSTKKNAAFLGVIPFFSAYGAVTGMNNSLCCGWKIVLIPKFKPDQFGNLLIKHKAVSALGVPRFWSDFAAEKVNIDLSFLKNPVCGGDKISPSEVKKINRYLLSHGGNRLKIGYGASEFGGGIVITTEKGSYDINSTGEILPGVVGMVIDPDTGEELGYYKDGELCFHSPTMMCGYLHNDGETRDLTLYKDNLKFYRTGDKGHIGENGCVYIVDRYKRAMMRPDGHTVHGTPIENVIMEHNDVDICAVVGIPLDSNAGVIPTAFIKLNENTSECQKKKLVDEIDKLCMRKIPERDKAHVYVIVDSLPYTLMGKIDYRALESNRFSELDYIIKDSTFFK